MDAPSPGAAPPVSRAKMWHPVLGPTPEAREAPDAGGLMDAYPMLARCAQHQLREDPPMWTHLLGQHGRAELLRPNLLLQTGLPRRCVLCPEDRREIHGGDEHGTLVPMMVLKAG